MKYPYLVCLLMWLSFFFVPAPTAHAVPADAEEAQQTKEAPDGAGETVEARNDETEEGLGEEEEYKNGFVFGFAHVLQLTQDRGTQLGSALGDRDNLYGVYFGFERVLHPHVSITFVKPFYFNRERLDSPFELLVNGLYRVNKWEPFVAAGILSVVRVFYSERDANGVAEKEFSFGLRFVGGFKYFITPHWAVSFELGYTFIPANDLIEHEITDSYLGAYFF